MRERGDHHGGKLQFCETATVAFKIRRAQWLTDRGSRAETRAPDACGAGGPVAKLLARASAELPHADKPDF
jgi:hypothetical protein